MGFFLPDLETDRLVLRMLSVNDAFDMYEYARDSEVCKYVTWNTHESVEDSMTYLSLVEKRYQLGEYFDWGVTLKETGKLIGTCGFVDINKASSRGEIGYVLSRTHWGKGLMSEAVRRVCSHGFEFMELNRIEARVFPENTRSQGVLKKLGFQYEGTLHQQQLIKGKYQDLMMFSMLKNEFR
ncbi:MAG: GNAT family protein [Caldisericales bacterium]|nr:GNAT family N-acetyltransferase [bacterium]